jgi:hypothetical protein
MARDPNGRFDTAMSFANAIRNSVATLGGPASSNDLARLLFTDFGDEMSARDEILKAADDPGPAIATLATPPSGVPAARRRPPTTPPPIPPQARSGEFANRQKQRNESLPIPSVITGEGTGRLTPPPTPPRPTHVQQDQSAPFEIPELPPGVLDLSPNMPVDTWMANPDTDLLKGHRMKGLMTIAVAVVVISVVAIGVYFLMNSGGGDNQGHTPTPADARKTAVTPVDAAPIAIDAPGTMSQEDIIALSRYGFFSIDANVKSQIYVDGKLVGETPLTRLPLKPGPHKVKAVGPRGKKPKEFDITIYATKDTDEPKIEW